MRVILVHGINTAEGLTNIGKLKPYIKAAGHECVLFEYGFISAWRARFQNPELARRLAQMTAPGDAVIGHSNGAAIIWLAHQKYEADFGRISLINPALDCDRQFSGMRPVTPNVYYNHGDDVVWWSKLLAKHPWGEMGRVGACTPGFRNIDCGATYGMPKVWGHSDIFTERCLPSWGPMIAAAI